MGAGTGCLPGPGWEENFWECQRVSLYTNQAFPAQMNMLRKPNTWRSNTIIKEIRKDQNSGLETETKTLSEHCCSQSHDCVRLLKGYSSKLFTIYSITKFKNSRNSAISKNCLKNPSLPSPCPSSHHRDVEGSQVGELRDLTGDVAPSAQSERGRDALGARGVLHVLQALGPGRGTHQPEEDQARCDQEVLETSLSSAEATKAAD